MSIKRLSFKQVLFFLSCITALLFFIYLGLSPFLSTQKPVPVKGDFKTNYSSFNKASPGKDTKNVFESINGLPSNQKTVNGKLYLFYPTPSDHIQNIAMFENNILVYATEEVFAKYRGAPEDYVKKFGLPELVMNDKNDEGIKWQIYPQKGVAVAIAVFENVVVKIVYFIPQDKNTFLKNLSFELGLVQKNITPSVIKESTN